MKIKIVPWAEPNAEGRWIDIPANIAAKVEEVQGWRKQIEIIAHLVPEGHFVCAFQAVRSPFDRDLSLPNRGDQSGWQP